MLPLWPTSSRRHVFSRHAFNHLTTVFESLGPLISAGMGKVIKVKACDDWNRCTVREASHPLNRIDTMVRKRDEGAGQNKAIM
jgi:hypothetical protein